MKSEAEIRRHRDHLHVCMAMPSLSWALGENDGMQELVDRMAKDVTDFTASN